MSNILDIYNTLVRIESNNHIAKRNDIYSRKQISEYYRLKLIELLNVMKRIDATKPKCITYSVSDQLYNNTECYLFTFTLSRNVKHHIPNRVFSFHLPKYLIKEDKEQSILNALNALNN